MNSHKNQLIQVVKRWHPIAPQAAFEQAMHELHTHDRADEYELRCAMWEALNYQELVFTSDRELTIRE